MPKKHPDLGAQFREATEAVGTHRRAQAQAEQAEQRWLKRHRGVPSHLLFDRTTGDPIDPALVELRAAVNQACLDVEWCRGTMVAAGEAFKGESLEAVIARNNAHRSLIAERRSR